MAARILTFVVALGAIFSLGSDAFGQCYFLGFSYESNDTNPSTNPGIPVTADFNRDGKADAAWPNRDTDTISIALGDGAGDFLSVTNIAAGDSPLRLFTGDFNRDGRPDLSVSSLSSVLLGNGSGGFTAGPNIANLIGLAAVADFNRDGIEDLLSTFAGSFRVFLGDGTGQFAAQTPVPIDGGNANTSVADINRDGRADIAISQFTERRVAIFLATVTGFGSQTNFGTAGRIDVGKLADVNNDNRLDLILSQSAGTADVAVLLGNGAGAFGPVTEYQAGFSPQSLSVGDFNGDGKIDLATGSGALGTPAVRVLPNIGNGIFGASTEVSSMGGPHNVVVADFNNDGKDDIFVTEQNSDTFGVLRNTCAGRSEVDPDFTGDDRSDIAFFRPSTGFWFVLRSEDNSFFSFPFGSNGDVPAAADYDGDRKSDIAVFRPSSGTWFIQRSTGGTVITQFGINGDVPLPNDYDGDGQADIAIYRPSNGEWWLLRSTTGLIALQFGAPGDIPIR